MTTITERKQSLLNRLRELDEAEPSGADESEIVMLDQQSVGRLNRMDALQRQQIAKETNRRKSLEKAKIAAALKRIDDDEYGWCADCGSEIAQQRLDIDPAAYLCIECAK